VCKWSPLKDCRVLDDTLEILERTQQPSGRGGRRCSSLPQVCEKDDAVSSPCCHSVQKRGNDDAVVIIGPHSRPHIYFKISFRPSTTRWPVCGGYLIFLVPAGFSYLKKIKDCRFCVFENLRMKELPVMGIWKFSESKNHPVWVFEKNQIKKTASSEYFKNFQKTTRFHERMGTDPAILGRYLNFKIFFEKWGYI
jgi:hypothetical protein